MESRRSNSFDSRKSATLRLLGEYQALAKGSSEQISLVAANRLEKLLEVASQSAWWRNHLGLARGSSDKVKNVNDSLARMPFLDREVIQKNFDWLKIWIPGSQPDDYVETSTSGSTGQPVRIKHYLPLYQLHYGAQELLDVVWSKREINRNFGYFRISQPPDSGRKLGEPFNYLGETGRVFGKKILGASPESLLEFIEQNQLSYISINAMLQRILALEQLANPRPNIRVHQMLNWADPVSSELRQIVRSAFGAEIVDRYSSNEFGYLALQCPGADHLHAPQVNNFIEILDSDNQPVQPGESGRVVVTALNNYSQPLIRYELGDYASWGEGCKLGITFPILQPTIVRARDSHLDSSGQIRIPYPDALSIVSSGAVSRFQVFRFDDLIVLLAQFVKNVSSNQITQTQIELEEQFNIGLKAAVVEFPESLAKNLSSWKNRRVVTVAGPAPQPLIPESLIRYFPAQQIPIAELP